jgi:deoxyribodipyrimidine photo-lyase
MKPRIQVMWFRRDIRLSDNAALYYALRSGVPVLPVFIFDKNILDKLDDKADRRVEFIPAALAELQQQLVEMGSSLEVYHDYPREVYKKLLEKYDIQTVFTNHDYEPYAKERDVAIAALLKEYGAGFKTYKDQVIFEKNEVVKDDDKPYTVFSPYARKWRAKLNKFYLKAYPTEKYFTNFYQQSPIAVPSLVSIGFQPVALPFPSKALEEAVIRHYGEKRNFPALEKGTSKMGVHLRFGTISIRYLAGKAMEWNDVYLNEFGEIFIMLFPGIFHRLVKVLLLNPSMIKLSGGIMKLNLNTGAMVQQDTLLLMQVCVNSMQQVICTTGCV